MIAIVLKGGESERGGVTCGKGPRVRFEPGSAASRVEPLYMGRQRYPLRHHGAPKTFKFIIFLLYQTNKRSEYI